MDTDEEIELDDVIDLEGEMARMDDVFIKKNLGIFIL